MTKASALTDPKISTLRADRAKELGLDKAIKAAKPGSDEYKALCLKRDRFIRTDTRGLFLDVDYTKLDETKRFTWRVEVRSAAGKRTKSTLGYYPALSIDDARKLAQADQTAVVQAKVKGEAVVTPSKARRLTAIAVATQAAVDAENLERIKEGKYPIGTFGDLAKRVYDHDVALWKGGERGETARKFLRTMQAHVVGWFDAKPIAEVTVADINAMRQRVLAAKTKNKTKGGKTALQQTLRFVGYVFDLAVDEGLIELKPIQEPTRKNAKKAQAAGEGDKHPGVITLPLMGRVLRSIFAEKSPTRLDARDALLMVFLTAQRRFTIINMEWAEISLQHREWRIPKAKLKKCGDAEAKHDHVVPLPQMAIDLLTIRWAGREMGKRKSRFVFPSRSLKNDFDHTELRKDKLTGEMVEVQVDACGQSETLMSELLNDNGWKGVHTPHGTRTTFRSLIIKTLGGYLPLPDGRMENTHLLAEIQLAHTNGKEMKELTANMTTTYYENDALEERRVMMDKWAALVEKALSESEPEEIGFMANVQQLAAPTLALAA